MFFRVNKSLEIVFSLSTYQLGQSGSENLWKRARLIEGWSRCWEVSFSYKCHASSNVTSSDADVPDRCGVEFGCVDRHDGVASADCELSCEFQPKCELKATKKLIWSRSPIITNVIFNHNMWLFPSKIAAKKHEMPQARKVAEKSHFLPVFMMMYIAIPMAGISTRPARALKRDR